MGGRLFTLAVKIAQSMKKTLGLEYMNVMQNNGSVAGQTVDHFHMHLIPRYENDGIQIAYKPLELTDEQIGILDGDLDEIMNTLITTDQAKKLQTNLLS